MVRVQVESEEEWLEFLWMWLGLGRMIRIPVRACTCLAEKVEDIVQNVGGNC